MDEKQRIDDGGSAVKRDVDPAAYGPRNVCPPGAGKRDGDPLCGQTRDVRPPSHADGTVIAGLAGELQGSVKRSQLIGAGVSRHVIDRRATTGDLHRVHRGVYIAGHLALAPLAREAAAILACGDRAVVSHRTAAWIWGLIPEEGTEIDVTLVGRRCRPKDGVRLHLAAALDRQDVRLKDGILLTAPARTLVDFAGIAEDEAELERTVSEARVLKLIRDGELEAAVGRATPRAGVARMRRLLQAETDTGFTRKEAERLMRRLIRDAGLPPALANARANGFEVDFLWPEHRLIVEVDGYQFHGHRGAFERDRRKDQALIAAGYRVMRVTWRQLRYEPIRVAVAIASALAAGRARG